MYMVITVMMVIKVANNINIGVDSKMAIRE